MVSFFLALFPLPFLSWRYVHTSFCQSFRFLCFVFCAFSASIDFRFVTHIFSCGTLRQNIIKKERRSGGKTYTAQRVSLLDFIEAFNCFVCTATRKIWSFYFSYSIIHLTPTPTHCFLRLCWCLWSIKQIPLLSWNELFVLGDTFFSAFVLFIQDNFPWRSAKLHTGKQSAIAGAKNMKSEVRGLRVTTEKNDIVKRLRFQLLLSSTVSSKFLLLLLPLGTVQSLYEI